IPHSFETNTSQANELELPPEPLTPLADLVLPSLGGDDTTTQQSDASAPSPSRSKTSGEALEQAQAPAEITADSDSIIDNWPESVQQSQDVAPTATTSDSGPEPQSVNDNDAKQAVADLLAAFDTPVADVGDAGDLSSVDAVPLRPTEPSASPSDESNTVAYSGREFVARRQPNRNSSEVKRFRARIARPTEGGYAALLDDAGEVTLRCADVVAVIVGKVQGASKSPADAVVEVSRQGRTEYWIIGVHGLNLRTLGGPGQSGLDAWKSFVCQLSANAKRLPNEDHWPEFPLAEFADTEAMIARLRDR
ncbi:MAG TPA: hypothetical protein DCQ06_04780, partial [Myxococcales bacterium]|nr:hypothetical protein [Myxococcales bacterium]